MSIDTDNFKEDLHTKDLLYLILNKSAEYCDVSNNENIIPFDVRKSHIFYIILYYMFLV